MIQIEDLLRIVVKERASDLVLKAGGLPAVRCHVTIKFVSDQALVPEMLEESLARILDEGAMKTFLDQGPIDRAVTVPNVGRFRCNAFRQSGYVSFVFRHI